MATVTTLEKMSGSANAMTQPVRVYDDGDPPASITEAAAKTAAEAAAPATVFGIAQDGNPGVEQEADFAWIITVSYRALGSSTLTRQIIGERRNRFQFQAKSKRITYAKEISRYQRTANFPAPPSNGLLRPVRIGNCTQNVEVTIDPPPVTLFSDFVVAIASVDDVFVWRVNNVVGKVNSVAAGIYKPGECMLVSANGQQIDDDSFKFSCGWGVKENEINDTFGSITGVDHDGLDHVETFAAAEPDRNLGGLVMDPVFVYVFEVWQRSDITSFGVSPPGAKP